MLSIIPASRVQLVVDLFADPAHRTTRPVPPSNPWLVSWSGLNRLLFLMPPAHLASPAVTKFLAENAAGLIALTDEATPTIHQAAAAAAHFTLHFPLHQDNCLNFADGPPLRPSSITAYAIFRNKQPTNSSVVSPLHPAWRELLPPQSTTITLDAWRHLLQWHPDKILVDTVLDAIEWGRAVHYTGARLTPKASARNSPDEHLVTLRQLRAAEFTAGWRAGPFPPPLPLFNLICNPTKLVLKGSKPRHVVDSSAPMMAPRSTPTSTAPRRGCSTHCSPSSPPSSSTRALPLNSSNSMWSRPTN